MILEIDECLKELYARPSPKNIYNKLLKILNISLDSFKIIHIGGTNGKGSVSHKIANCLKSFGFKVGLFTSPHIWTPCERISINGTLISNEDFIKYYLKISNVDQSINLRFFDVFMFMALLYFIDNNVEWIVFEVGIGGRLDSTNFITNTKLAIITSIGFDHTEILGNTLNDIAYEKAGIIKSNCTVVIGPSCTKYSVFKERCNELGCKIIQVTGEFTDFDTENTEIARIALINGLSLDSQIVNESIAIKPPLRFYKLEKFQIENIVKNNDIEIIIDVAHNLPGIQQLVKQLSVSEYANRRKFCIYFNSLGRSLDILNPLVTEFEEIYLASVDHSRISNNQQLISKLNGLSDSWLKDKLIKSLCKIENYFINNTPNYQKIIVHALEETIKSSGILILFGSFFAMIDVCNVLKLSPNIFNINNKLPSVKY